MDNVMRVLHIGKYYPPVRGGIETFLRDLIRAQRKIGIDAFAMVHGKERLAKAAEELWLVRVPVWFHLLFAPISPGFPFLLSRTIRKLQPAVLHLHLPNPSAFWVLVIPSARKIPWIVHWHSDVVPSSFNRGLRIAYPLYRPFEQALLARCSMIIPTSPTYLDASEPLFIWRNKCEVVPLGIDIDGLPPEPAQGEICWNEKVIRILAIGRLTYYKGFETLIRAVSGIRQIQLIIVGEGIERRTLAALIHSERQECQVNLLGEVDDKTKNYLLASCDFLCMPSRERTEAFGIVLMEAMFYAKPVIAGKIAGSGVIWVVDDGITGLLVPPEDTEKLREGIQHLCDDKPLRTRLGNEGRRQLLERFSIQVIAQTIQQIYRKVAPAIVNSASDQLLIVIPARNEAESIGGVLETLRKMGYEHIVVIDDCSADKTALIAEEKGATVLSPLLPQGAWGAMQTGIRYALRNGFGHVVTLDADGQHEPAYIQTLLQAGKSADVVVGAFPQRGSLLRQLAWRYFRAMTGFGIEDLTSGFRYYNTAACVVLADDEATLLDYQDVGVLLLLRRAGLSLAEVPVEMYDRQNGPSRIFSSWGKVGRYMLETTLLCMAHWHPKHFKR